MALLDEFLAVDIVTSVREGAAGTEQPRVLSISYCPVSSGNVGVPQTITVGDDGVQSLLSAFESYVFQTYTQPGKKWCLVTNGMWQLQTGLRQSAAAAGASLSNSWLRYFNIRSEAAKALQRSQSFADLDSCCNALGLTSYDSTPGENAASTLAYAVKALLQKQHQFAKPTVWDPDVAAAAPAVSAPLTVVAGSSCLRLRGIPFQSTESDLREFFSGFAVDKVVIRYDPVSGRPRGDALVSFTTAEEAERAMQARNQQVLGSRYIEIFSAQPDELAQAATMAQEFEHNTANILRLRGIPFQSSEGEVEALFRTNDIPIVPGSVVIAIGGDGRPSGAAFVKTASDDATARALALPRASTYMGTRYVEIYRATETEYQTAQRPRHMPAQPPAYYPSAPGEHIVRLRGLPYSATEMDIVTFFTGINIAPQGVHLVYNAESRPSGEAFVELVSAHDVQAALQLDRSQMAHRYIEVYQSSSAEMNRGGRGAAVGYGGQRYQPYGGYPGAHPGAMRPAMGRTAGADPYAAAYAAAPGAYRQPPRRF